MNGARLRFEYWLDVGAGTDAEHWCRTAVPASVRLVALDPLLTSGMVESGRLATLPDQIYRVGAEVRPLHSVEAGKQRANLPFRDGVFARVHCGFVLHLHLETLELLTAEVWRVLRPGGELQVLLPHFGDARSEAILQETNEALRRHFSEVILERYAGPFTTFWADLYQDRTYSLRCRKPGGN